MSASQAASSDPTTLRARREALVREHMESENVHDFDTTMRTFGHPRYELIATGETYDDAVIAEFVLLGTHLGPLRALPPTGRSFRCQMTALFLFEGEDLVCERVYFDQLTILRQLGLARDPRSALGRIALALNHPLTIARAVIGARRAGRP